LHTWHTLAIAGEYSFRGCRESVRVVRREPLAFSEGLRISALHDP
jgi:hypothetical protein